MADEHEIVAPPAPVAPADRKKITFSREFSVALPSAERAYVIPASEWERVKKMVRKIASPKDWLLVAASICAGVFVSAIFCLLGFSASWDKVPIWAKALACSVAVCALVLSAVLFWLDGQQRGKIRESTTDVTDEMEQMEKLSHTSESEPAEPSAG